MTLAFDTLKASRSLRDAGMDERTADAVVAVVQQTTAMPDISHVATKADVEPLATKNDVERLRSDFSEKLRVQGLALTGVMIAIAGAIVAVVKLVP